jgi:hypothetical protein
MLFPRFAQSATALALLTIGFAAPACAQNNKQIISGTWYEDRANSGNINSATFTLAFAQTPANQFLNITNISCGLELDGNQSATVMYLVAGQTSGAADLGRPYSILGSPIPVTGGGAKYYSIVQNGIFFKFGPGRFPSIQIFSVSTGSFSTVANCTIVGNLTDN